MDKNFITESFRKLELVGYKIYVGDIIFGSISKSKGNNRPVNDVQHCTVQATKGKSLNMNLIDYLMDLDEYRYTLTDILDGLSDDYKIEVNNTDIYFPNFMIESKNKYILTDNDHLNIGFIDLMRIYNYTKQEYKDVVNSMVESTKINISASYQHNEVLIFGTPNLSIDKLKEIMIYLKSLVTNNQCTHDITKGNLQEFFTSYDKCFELLDECSLVNSINNNGLKHFRLSLLSEPQLFGLK